MSRGEVLHERFIRERIDALARELSPEEPVSVSPEQRLRDDLGYTSLGLLDLAFTIEADFELDAISTDDAAEIETLRDVEELVIELLRRSGRVAA